MFCNVIFKLISQTKHCSFIKKQYLCICNYDAKKASLLENHHK